MFRAMIPAAFALFLLVSCASAVGISAPADKTPFVRYEVDYRSNRVSDVLERGPDAGSAAPILEVKEFSVTLEREFDIKELLGARKYSLSWNGTVSLDGEEKPLGIAGTVSAKKPDKKAEYPGSELVGLSLAGLPDAYFVPAFSLDGRSAAPARVMEAKSVQGDFIIIAMRRGALDAMFDGRPPVARFLADYGQEYRAVDYDGRVLAKTDGKAFFVLKELLPETRTSIAMVFAACFALERIIIDTLFM